MSKYTNEMRAADDEALRQRRAHGRAKTGTQHHANVEKTYTQTEVDRVVAGALDSQKHVAKQALPPEAWRDINAAVASVNARRQLTPAEAEVCEKTGTEPVTFLEHKRKLQAIGARK